MLSSSNDHNKKDKCNRITSTIIIMSILLYITKEELSTTAFVFVLMISILLGFIGMVIDYITDD
jgi:hypothetical protein